MHAATIYTGLLCSLAAPALGVVFEQLAGGAPNGWTLVDTPAAGSTISLSVALTRENLDQLESKLLSVSTPGQPDYGKWLDKDDIDAQFPVANDAAVVSWLKSAGVTSISSEGGLVNFAAPVSIVNKLLNTTFAYYQSGSTVKLRTTEYSVPSSLANSIALISPTVFFGNTKSAAPTPSSFKSSALRARDSSSSCENLITPACLNEMYNIGDYTPEVSSGSRIGFGSFLNESASYADLAAYEALFDIPAQNFTVLTINGGVDDQSASAQLGEADLDVELIVAVAHPLPVVEFITGGSPPFIPDADEPTAADNQNEPYLNYYEYLLTKTNAELPQVISNSYGDDEQTVPEYYAKHVCDLIGLTTLRGISILESSGDEGVGSACQASDGITPQFQPIFPATCPWVTAVGGTQSVFPEVAWNGSSGGFSNYFPRAGFQASAVETYLKSLSEETKEYYGKYTNFNGRGFPDVAAHSLWPDFEVIYFGQKSRSGGTSAASPTFAGVIGLLNDARLRAGKPALGYLNPFLYSQGFKALTDITAGGSYGCGGVDPQSGQEVPGALIIPGAHWNATEGWDPVTGLGTPNFQELKNLVLKL